MNSVLFKELRDMAGGGQIVTGELLAERLQTLIQEGRFPEGAALPSVRNLGEEIGVSRQTVSRAYQVLSAKGLVRSVVGSGTYVRGGVPAPKPVAGHGERSLNALMNKDLKIWFHKGTRLLATPRPDISLFRTDEYEYCIRTVMSGGTPAFDLAPYTGVPKLQVQICRLVERRGIEVEAGGIQVTAGATDALAAIIQGLASKGDRVLVENPTVRRFLLELQSFGVQPIPVEGDEYGPTPQSVAELARRHDPKFLFLTPNFSNPTGLHIPQGRRDEILKVAEKTGLIIVEDDVFYNHNYDGLDARPMRARKGGASIIYVDGFNKAISLGLRVGYFTATPDLHEHIVMTYEAVTHSNSYLPQAAMAMYIEEGFYKEHLRRAMPRYKERRDALITALMDYMPKGATWTHPSGGYGTIVKLPSNGSYSDLYEAAIEKSVAYLPGELFFADRQTDTFMRLCFGMLPPTALREAVATLGELVRERTPR